MMLCDLLCYWLADSLRKIMANQVLRYKPFIDE